MEKTILESFMNNVYPEPNTGCWLWGRALDHDGYGITWMAKTKPRQQRAHRLSYYLHHGEFDTRLMVLHKCDNPSCVNPDHLFLGTVQDNSDDMKRKGRQAKGRTQWLSKLVDTDIIKIRELYANGQPYRSIAKLYNIAFSNVAFIVKRKTWKHL